MTVQEELVRRSEALGLRPRVLREVIDAVNQNRNPMYALVLAVGIRESVDRAIAYLVAQCRGAGMTWVQIGHALGVSKQAAQKKYDARQ